MGISFSNRYEDIKVLHTDPILDVTLEKHPLFIRLKLESSTGEDGCQLESPNHNTIFRMSLGTVLEVGRHEVSLCINHFAYYGCSLYSWHWLVF